VGGFDVFPSFQFHLQLSLGDGVLIDGFADEGVLSVLVEE